MIELPEYVDSQDALLDSTLDLGGEHEIPYCEPIDLAVDAICVDLGLPVLGGPSGEGWSYFSTAQRCPHLFRQLHDNPKAKQRDPRPPAEPLQVGSLFHTLQALYYAAIGGGDGWRQLRRGLILPRYVQRGRPAPSLTRVPMMATVDLLAALDDRSKKPGGPSKAVILKAARAHELHTEFYDRGGEDLTPLAIEWWAGHRNLGYTCRYDMIVQLGEHDPMVDGTVIKPGAVVVVEHKTAAFLSEFVLDGWWLDGQILGQIMLWEPSGCEDRFGPLAGVVVDIVTKGKVAECRRIIIPPSIPQAGVHQKWMRMLRSDIERWRATGIYEQRWSSCIDRFGFCSEWANCAHRDLGINGG